MGYSCDIELLIHNVGACIDVLGESSSICLYSGSCGCYCCEEPFALYKGSLEGCDMVILCWLFRIWCVVGVD